HIIFWEIDLVKHNRPKTRDKSMQSLEIAPRLSHLIRHLSISLNRQLLEGVVRQTALPNLEEVSVHCTDRQYYHNECIKTRFLVQSILRQPTIRRVTLSGAFKIYRPTCRSFQPSILQPCLLSIHEEVIRVENELNDRIVFLTGCDDGVRTEKRSYHTVKIKTDVS
ncbi:hypothetical protein C8R47DRAFT_1099864, partial [Mycena vitilis]